MRLPAQSFWLLILSVGRVIRYSASVLVGGTSLAFIRLGSKVSGFLLTSQKVKGNALMEYKGTSYLLLLTTGQKIPSCLLIGLVECR